MRRNRFTPIAVLVVVAALFAAACSSSSSTEPEPQTSANVNDLLSKVKADGTIRVATDPNYKPQSYLGSDGEMTGFDVEVAQELAKRLGVEVEWVTPKWGTIISGSWGDRWDVSVGSMTPLPDRQEVLYFTPGYRFDPVGIAVSADDTTSADVTTDFDGKTIGVCGGCTYDYFLQGTLSAPGLNPDFVIDDPVIKTYETDKDAIADLELGRLDAVISTQSTLEDSATDKGEIRVLPDELYKEPVAVALDKGSSLPSQSLADALAAELETMQSDGTLTAISEKYYNGEDKTQP